MATVVIGAGLLFAVAHAQDTTPTAPAPAPRLVVGPYQLVSVEHYLLLDNKPPPLGVGGEKAVLRIDTATGTHRWKRKPRLSPDGSVYSSNSTAVAKLRVGNMWYYPSICVSGRPFPCRIVSGQRLALSSNCCSRYECSNYWKSETRSADRCAATLPLGPRKKMAAVAVASLPGSAIPVPMRSLRMRDVIQAWRHAGPCHRSGCFARRILPPDDVSISVVSSTELQVNWVFRHLEALDSEENPERRVDGYIATERQKHE